MTQQGEVRVKLRLESTFLTQSQVFSSYHTAFEGLIILKHNKPNLFTISTIRRKETTVRKI